MTDVLDVRPPAAPGAFPGAGTSTAVVTALEALERVDAGVARGAGVARTWATGFTPLDAHLGGGLHAGDLALLAGSQGTGKTTVALQVARNMAASGDLATYVCYEHTPGQLLERLLVLEAALHAGTRAPTQEEVRRRLSAGGDDLVGALDGLPGGLEALRAIAAYGPRLRLVGARGDVTGLAELRALASSGDGPGLLVVDYLQKVAAGDMAGVPDGSAEDVRVARTATALKDLALETACPVLAVAAVDRAGLDAPRIRARHVKGSVTAAYEADVILVLQEKWDVVARQHLMYDLVAGEEFHRWVVWTLEKNRHGADHVEMEFRKRLAHALVEPHGRIVAEQLVSERMHGESG